MSKMRFFLTITALFLIVSLRAFAQTPTVEFAAVQKGFSSTGERMPLYREGRVMVKFTRDAVRDLAVHEAVVSKAGQPLTLELPSFDVVARPYRLAAIQPALKLTLRNALLAESLGSNRWYALDFAPGDMEALAATLRQDPNVEDATPRLRRLPGGRAHRPGSTPTTGATTTPCSFPAWTGAAPTSTPCPPRSARPASTPTPRRPGTARRASAAPA